MNLAHARFPAFSLDGKRVVATSVALAAHGLALMLLMMPAQRPPAPIVSDRDESLPILFREPIKPALPPPPTVPVVRSVPRPHTMPTATASAVNPTSIVDSNISIDASQETGDDNGSSIEETSDPGSPSPAQLSADIAPPPPYPTMAKRRGIDGLVMLRILVDSQGRPQEGRIETSSGSNLLDQAALKFVLRHWHFHAAMQDGVAVPAYALVPIEFVLDK
jgi:protein TonB